MSSASANNKRIAKNTLLLYFRMIVTTFISLYTARLTLQLLGVEDYGISNVVGGIIGFMGILTGTMLSATQRFLAYDLGKGDIKQYQKTFSMLVNIFICFGLLGGVFLEIIGPWMISNKLIIPESRLLAAQCVFQFSVIIFILNSIVVPYTSSIIAYEKMSIFAYFTFIDIFFKLAVVYSLYVTPYDKLITVNALGLIMSFVTSGIYIIYCIKKLAGCRYIKFWDKQMFKRIGSYAGWNLLGSTTTVMNQQGQAVLLNMFFGPVVNAAKAIADKINTVIFSFCTNFYMAVTPQIIKSYASNNIDQMRTLVLNSSKYSFYLLWVISSPLMSNMQPILNLWLGKEQVSNEMVKFCQLILIYSLVNVLEQPMTQTVRATGNIKKYQIQIGVITLLFIPISYILFECGLPAYSSMVVLVFLYAIAQFVRVYFASSILKISLTDYYKKVITPIVLVVVSTLVIVFMIDLLNMNLIVKTMLLYVSTALLILIVGINKDERGLILSFIKKKNKSI